MPRTVRPVGPEKHDVKCPDGFVCAGWRRICSGGYVRFQRGRHYHESLSDHVGSWVFVELDDPWAVNVNVWMDSPYKGEMLKCANEKDWKADDQETARTDSRRRPKRVCN